MRLNAAGDKEPNSACPNSSPGRRRGSFPRLLSQEPFLLGVHFSSYFSVSPTADFIGEEGECVCVCEGGGGATGQEGRKIFTPKRATCVIFSPLPLRSGCFSFSSNRPETAPNSPPRSSDGAATTSDTETIPPVCDGCSVCCVSPPTGLRCFSKKKKRFFFFS